MAGGKLVLKKLEASKRIASLDPCLHVLLIRRNNFHVVTCTCYLLNVGMNAYFSVGRICEFDINVATSDYYIFVGSSIR